MAIVKVGTYRNPPEDITDYEAMVAHLDAYTRQVGNQGMILTEWTNTTNVPKIAMGSYISHGGVLYVVEDEDYVLPALSVDGTYYIRVAVSGETLALDYITDLTGYVWNAIYNGLYHPDGKQVLPYQVVKSGASVGKWKITNLMQVDGFNIVNYLGESSRQSIDVTIAEIAVGALIPTRKTGSSGIMSAEFGSYKTTAQAWWLDVERFIIAWRDDYNHSYISLYKYMNGTVTKLGSDYGPYATTSDIPEILVYDSNTFFLSLHTSTGDVYIINASESGLTLQYTVNVTGNAASNISMAWIDKTQKIFAVCTYASSIAKVITAYSWDGSSGITSLATYSLASVYTGYLQLRSISRNYMILNYITSGTDIMKLIFNLLYDNTTGYSIQAIITPFPGNYYPKTYIQRFLSQNVVLGEYQTGLSRYPSGELIYASYSSLAKETVLDINDNGTGLAIMRNQNTSKCFIGKFEYGKI